VKKPFRYVLVILCLLGISLGSGVVGVKIGFELAKRKYRQRSNPEAWNVQAMRELDRRLGLEPGQRERIQTLMNKAVEQLKETRRDTLERSGQVVDRLFSAVDAELSPRQQVIFRELIRDRERVKREIIKEDGDLKRSRLQAGPADAPRSNANASLKRRD